MELLHQVVRGRTKGLVATSRGATQGEEYLNHVLFRSGEEERR